jgi:alkaline phosphatase D
MTPAETPVLGEVDPYLINTIYYSDDVEASLANVQDDARFNALVEKYDLHLFGGPMLGCVGPTSVKVWVRTAKPAKVQVVVDGGGRSKVVQTSAKGDYTAVLDIDGLKPWTEYGYDVLVDGQRALGDLKPRFRTSPTRDQKVEFTVAFGGGARYVPQKERMWDTIAKHRPHAFLFLGDNLYIDEPQHRGKQRAMYYRRQLRPEYRRMVSQSGMYAIWDDHDFGDDDSAGGLHPFKPAWKVPVWNVFRGNWVNPYYAAAPISRAAGSTSPSATWTSS